MTAESGARVLALFSATDGISVVLAGGRLATALRERGLRLAILHPEGARPPVETEARTTTASAADCAAPAISLVALPAASASPVPDPLAYVQAVEQACDGFDFVLIDCDPAFGPLCGVLPLLADDLILFTPPRPAVLAEAYAAIKWLHHRGLRGSVRLVVLHSGDREHSQRAARRLQRTALRFLGRAVTYLGPAPLERVPRGVAPARRSPPAPPQRAAWGAVADALLGAAPAGAESSAFWLRLAQLFL